MKKLYIALPALVLAALFSSASAKAQHQPTPRDLAQAGTLDGDPVLFAQAPALFCYTAYGRFPMLTATPPGFPCSVPNVPYWGYVAWGTTGY